MVFGAGGIAMASSPKNEFTGKDWFTAAAGSGTKPANCSVHFKW